MKLLKRSEINTEKWDACVTRSTKPLIYGLSWYLDAACKNWSGLVWGDYEAILPLPWNKKLIKKQIYVPHPIQQLGPFLLPGADIDLHKAIQIIEKKFIRIELSTTKNLNNSSSKTNFILPLEKEYDEIYSSFRKDRKAQLKKIEKFNQINIKNIDKNVFLKFYEEQGNTLIKENRIDWGSFKRVIDVCSTKNHCLTYGVFNSETLICTAFYTKFEKRLTQLLLISNEMGYELNAATYLISEIMKKFADSEFIYDFEGSELPGVKSFFKSFGAKKESYYLYRKQDRILLWAAQLLTSLSISEKNNQLLE